MRKQPTDVLPPEILSIIFLEGLPSYTHRFKVDRHRRSISQVCRSWRAFCIDTPLLWRALYISHKNISTGDDWERLKLLIERARTVPLDLSIYFYDLNNPSINQATLSRLTGYLTPLLPRVRNLHYTSIHMGAILAFFPLPRSMPFLRKLRLILAPWPMGHKFITLWRHDSSFPLLESLSVEGPSFETINSTLDGIPRGQVRHFNVNHIFCARERIGYISQSRHLDSLGWHPLHLEEARLQNSPDDLPRFCSNTLHSLIVNGSIHVLLRLLDTTHSIRHLELSPGGVECIDAAKSTDFIHLRTISLRSSPLTQEISLYAFISTHPTIFAIELNARDYYKLLPLLFSGRNRKAHNVSFIRVVATSDWDLCDVPEAVMRDWLESPWTSRLEWNYLDFTRRDGAEWPNGHERIQALANSFPEQFRWIEEDEAVPFDKIASLGPDGWPSCEEAVQRI
ncbi:uncharacterized protein EI90DRAFT_3115167 [Cantharellus anzutake]|uniref:uncharacterized protein n=1 Tax=Cantharellus anzutake TaxID=1750568 RepID=UPI001904469D|nr:uncharacterized protein EI90DRAFT_3115167 [Cantharellus anzutake]KAF8342582.1 hypothetical protein EI90DRAFT_3115167 [Cantharellus anzutake]